MNLIKINTPCGEVQGESLETYNVFRGIRYANAERFERPIQVKNWVGLYDATEFKTGVAGDNLGKTPIIKRLRLGKYQIYETSLGNLY